MMDHSKCYALNDGMGPDTAATARYVSTERILKSVLPKSTFATHFHPTADFVWHYVVEVEIAASLKDSDYEGL